MGRLVPAGSSNDRLRAPRGVFSDVSAGWDSVACALEKNSKRVRCWGDSPLVDAIPKLGSAARVAVGGALGCIVHAAGPKMGKRLSCTSGRRTGLGTPSISISDGERRYHHIHVGGTKACGLAFFGSRGGSAKAFCWDLSGNTIPGVPDTKLRQVSAFGYAHACGLKDDGTVQCWGSAARAPNPPKGSCKDTVCGQAHPPKGIRFTQIAAGFMHTCGVTEAGKIACWGAGHAGGKGPYAKGQSNVPADLR